MSLFRPSGFTGGVMERRFLPGDTFATAENLLNGGIATAGNGTWTAAAIASGIINRTGPTGAYTDTTDTAANIIAGVAGGAWEADFMAGVSFRLRVINTVAYQHTFAAGTGVKADTAKSTLGIAASTWREYIVTLLNGISVQILQCNTTNASATVTFVLPSNAISLPLMGSNGPIGAISDLVGSTVTGTNIAAGTTVIGVTQGQGGAIGVTLSANATGTGSNLALTFGPTVQMDSIGSGTL